VSALFPDADHTPAGRERHRERMVGLWWMRDAMTGAEWLMTDADFDRVWSTEVPVMRPEPGAAVLPFRARRGHAGR
jgi:hypothetical protein